VRSSFFLLAKFRLKEKIKKNKKFENEVISNRQN
jgi:hypothetical protein